MKKTKSKNKFLLTTSLSVVMGMTSFAAMAQTSTSMEQKDKLAKTVEVINAEVNTPFPDTNNKVAIYPKDVDNEYRTRPNNENFEFNINNKPINYKSSGDISTVNFTGYKIKSNDVTSNGFIVGHKEVENSGNPDVGTEGRFFKYWEPDARSEVYKNGKLQSVIEPDGQYSPSFPKLCYNINGNGMTPYSTTIEDKKGNTHPLIKLARDGGASNPNKNEQMRYLLGGNSIILPLVSINEKEYDKYKTTELYKNYSNIQFNAFDSSKYNIVSQCNTQQGCSLTWNPTRGCYEINRYGDRLGFKVNDADPTKGFSFINNRTASLVNCSSGTSGTCPSNQVQSFRRNNSNEPYRISQFVKLDIEGNIEPIEVPQQTCYNCVDIGKAIDATCEHIVDEVFKAKNGNCAETVKALAIHPRDVKSWLPYDLNSPSNCKSCLCKIEGLLQAKVANKK